MLQKILRLLFIIIISVICLALVAILLPVLLIGIIIAVLTGKFRVARFRSGYGQVNNQEQDEESNAESTQNEEYQTAGDVIDIQAVEIEDKKAQLD